MIIQSNRVWLAGDFLPAQLEIENETITNVYPYGNKTADKDFGDKRVVPGFYDIHCHGAYGFDTNEAEPEGLRNWARTVVHEGVCGFMATTITQSHEVLSKAVKNVANVVKEGYEGAHILGVHFEGPYLDMVKKGAQPPQFIQVPNVEEFKEYQNDANGLIKIITLAPEHDPDLALTKYCASHGVVVSIGHSNATFEEAMFAIANGAKSMTHVYNGMSGFNHRANGLVGAALRCRDVYGEVICDCHHSTPEALNIYFTAKGRDKGFAPGTTFGFGGNQTTIYPDGTAHLADGTLAGSTMKTNEGLRNLVEKAMVPFDAALNSCTINPMELIGEGDHRGKLAVGYEANVVVLDDDYSVLKTFVSGIEQF